MVVNEAMNFGLPIVVSDRVGCGPDLVRSGHNGYVVRHRDEGALAEAICTLVADAELRARMGQQSLRIIRDWGQERCAEGIVKACQSVARKAAG